MDKYFGDDKQEISRRDFKEFIVELVTNKTPEEIIEIHKKVDIKRADKKIIYMEKVLLEFMDQHKERKFKKQYVEQIIQNKELENYVSQKIMDNTNKNLTEQHHHQRRKEIVEKVEEAVQKLTGGEL